jgi:hypothetical protein
MRYLKIFICVTAFIWGCSSDKSTPDKYFSKEQQSSLILQTVRYSAKVPHGATHQTKFSKEFDKYYYIAAKETDFRKCEAAASNNGYFFLMTRQAKSIWPAREAIGGRFTLNEKDSLEEYEEIFRTWKMTEDSLNTRAFELFDLMVAGKDLTPYRSKYKGDRYIEFPDDRFFFSKEDKQWHDKALDSL